MAPEAIGRRLLCDGGETARGDGQRRETKREESGGDGARENRLLKPISSLVVDARVAGVNRLCVAKKDGVAVDIVDVKRITSRSVDLYNVRVVAGHVAVDVDVDVVEVCRWHCCR